MKRSTLIAGIAVSVLALLTTGAFAQGWGGGLGCRWMTFSPENAQKAASLQQKLCQAQQTLRQLQIQQSDQKQIEQKTAEVLRLRGELAKLANNVPAGTTGQALVGRGLGLGPCGMGLGLGRGGGRGMGYGRRAGACWRW